MKNKKRLFASLMSVALAVSSLMAFNTSALLRINSNEAIMQEMESYGFAYIPEAIDYFADIVGHEGSEMFAKDKIDNGLWLTDSYDDTMEFYYKQIIDDFALFYFDIPSGDYSAAAEELKEKIGYSDKVNIEVHNENCYDEEIKGGVRRDVGIYIGFSENGTDLNYMIAEKAASILKEKYDITKSIVSIGRVQLYDMRITMQYYPVQTAAEADVLTDEQLEEFNNTLAENGFSIRSCKSDAETVKEFNDKRGANRKQLFYLDIPEDTTVQEKLRYAAFVKEYYGCNPVLYALSSAKQYSGVFDILEVENSYNQGDANEDGVTDLADATAIIQAIGNPKKYALSAQGEFNADTDGNGLTGADALRIQKQLVEAGMPE